MKLLRGPREEATVEVHAEFGGGWLLSSRACGPDGKVWLSPMECVINKKRLICSNHIIGTGWNRLEPARDWQESVVET